MDTQLRTQQELHKMCKAENVSRNWKSLLKVSVILVHCVCFEVCLLLNLHATEDAE